MKVELTGRDVALINGALSAQLRYHRSNLDKAKTDEAVDNHARNCVELRDLIRRLDHQVR